MGYNFVMDETMRRALQAISDSNRRLADELDRLLGAVQSPEAPRTTELGSSKASSPSPSPVWDPETDPPFVTPRVVGTREEQDWCCLTYLGGIYAINKRYGRGASSTEVREYAIKAGYRDGRAVTAWSKGNGATQNDANKQRWVNANGVDHWVKGLAAKLGLRLPADLAEDWAAPDFTPPHTLKRNSTTSPSAMT